MNWPDFIREGRARWIGGGGVFVGIAGIVLGQTLLAPEYELLYSGGEAVAHCFQREERQICSLAYELTLGNTGKKAHDSVRVSWPLDLQNWDVATQVSDIIASAERTPQPQIRPAFESNKTVYTISALMPNTLVRFWVRCLMCTPEQARALRHARASIEARGVVTEADPRLSALLHGAMNVLRLVGLFY